ncbi:MAG: hypothetical protein JRE23_03220 [Deltaproteobacteria bacterium]|nr:hypothetical protein [Deltaproteobacteria bacterium]
MDIREFAYLQKSEKKEAETVDLVCDRCGGIVTRPRSITLTGHVHDQTCTYVCTTCRGNMREFNPNWNEEK